MDSHHEPFSLIPARQTERQQAPGCFKVQTARLTFYDAIVAECTVLDLSRKRCASVLKNLNDVELATEKRNIKSGPTSVFIKWQANISASRSKMLHLGHVP
ncbi:hypothetical protein HG530_001668 [Fusarium avenaceum]|nr:hypothetical protein HG530_001668 [Fusarium avenaceum]